MDREQPSAYELRMRIQARREAEGAAVQEIWDLGQLQQIMEERDEDEDFAEDDDIDPAFVCDVCGEEVIPGEGCDCDFCGQCGQSKANDECECDE